VALDPEDAEHRAQRVGDERDAPREASPADATARDEDAPSRSLCPLRSLIRALNGEVRNPIRRTALFILALRSHSSAGAAEFSIAMHPLSFSYFQSNRSP